MGDLVVEPGDGDEARRRTVVTRDLEEGRLVAVLRDWELPILNMNIAYQNRARPPAKIKAFADFLIGKVRADAMSGIRY